jgi:hypothetical protein
VLLSAVAPYSTCSLAWLGQELGTDTAEAEALAVAAILDGRLAATVDQVRGSCRRRPWSMVWETSANGGWETRERDGGARFAPRHEHDESMARSFSRA